MVLVDNTQLFDIESYLDAISDSKATSLLKTYYGSNSELIARRSQKIAGLLDAFRRRFPNDRQVAVFRIPGRINLMGVHVDHRGGWCNYLPIARETFFCVSPRSDDHIAAWNVSPQYPDAEFSISSERSPSTRGRWMEFIDAVALERGHWINYLKAGALKLQDSFPDTPLHGMNLVADGDIPPQSGLSSSSTLVVGTVMALCHVNGIAIPPFERIELCGEGEWYVGTRGGCGDHAAMILGRLNLITHTGFKPLSASYCPIPAGVEVLIAQSGIQANKATRARETFNSRIAAYEAAYAIFADAHPQFRDRLAFLRDIAPDRLAMPLADFYAALKTVPVSAGKEELIRAYPHLHDTWDRIFSTYGVPLEALSLREALLFGVSECDRARRFPRLLEKSDAVLAGRFMYISHDGDRVTVWNGDRSLPYRSPYEDAYLDELSDRAQQSPDDESLAPAWQPGGYRCSVPELDRLVDRCKSLKGVLGAGITGAGLGGAILVLVRSEAAQDAIGNLKQMILLWHEGEPFVECCQPVSGASMVSL